MMGKAKTQQRLVDNLETEFGKVSSPLLSFRNVPTHFGLSWLTILLLFQVQREYHLPAGDFPNVEHFRSILNGYNIDKFEKLKPKMIQAVDDMLGYDIPELLKNFRNPYD